MIYAVEPFVTGPFAKETPYQNAVTDKLRTIWPSDTFVHLETEETEPGMPDTVRLSPFRPSLQIEYKVSDENGFITFKKSQPLWYRRHHTLNVLVVAWDKRYSRTVVVTADEIVKNASLRFKLPFEVWYLPFGAYDWNRMPTANKETT